MIIILILVSAYYIKLRKSYFELFIILLTLILLLFQIPKDNLSIYEGRIVSISKNYYTIKTKETKVLVYTKEDLNYDDYISYSGVYEKIESVDSKIGFNFQKYMKEKNIKYLIKATNIAVISKGKSIKARLNNKIKEHESKDYLSMVLLDYTYEDLDNSLSTLLLSSGLIIREILRHLKKILNKFLYSEYLILFEIIFLLFYLIFMRNIEFTLFLIIHRLLSKSNFEQLDKISISSIMILILFPNYLFSLSFQISNLFRFLSFIKVRRSNLFVNYLILIPIQLVNFYKVSIFQIMIFPYNKLINLIAYLSAYIDIFFKSNMSYTLSKKLLIEVDKIIITGRMSFIVLIIWIIITLKLLQKIKIRYLISLTLLLFINQHQLVFNPSLTYTQVYIGQGDLAILTYPFKRDVLLIDTGSSFNQSKLEVYLNYYGIKEINTIIISHYDEDHSGNLDFLINNYDVLNIVDNSSEFYFHNLKINSIKYDFEDNDGSLITFFKVNDISYLSLGDVSKEIENLFIKDFDYLDYKIVKLAHHGSNTSTSSTLVSKDSLLLALNSSGKNNQYNHPSRSVLKLLNDHQIPILDTQDYGDIKIIHFFNHNFIKLK